MKTYKVIFKENRGCFNVASLADSVKGTWHNAVSEYDGTHDLAFVDVDDDFAPYLEELMMDDENIISWSEV